MSWVCMLKVREVMITVQIILDGLLEEVEGPMEQQHVNQVTILLWTNYISTAVLL